MVECAEGEHVEYVDGAEHGAALALREKSERCGKRKEGTRAQAADVKCGCKREKQEADGEAGGKERGHLKEAKEVARECEMAEC